MKIDNINDRYKYYAQYVIQLLDDSCYSEDGKLYIKNKMKYDIYNLTNDIFPEYIDELEKELEIVDE